LQTFPHWRVISGRKTFHGAPFLVVLGPICDAIAMLSPNPKTFRHVREIDGARGPERVSERALGFPERSRRISATSVPAGAASSEIRSGFLRSTSDVLVDGGSSPLQETISRRIHLSESIGARARARARTAVMELFCTSIRDLCFILTRSRLPITTTPILSTFHIPWIFINLLVARSED